MALPQDPAFYPPYGCADCGIRQDHHGIQYSARLKRLHNWLRPSDALIKERMLCRRNGASGARR